jgi:hypothetical protein
VIFMGIPFQACHVLQLYYFREEVCFMYFERNGMNP